MDPLIFQVLNDLLEKQTKAGYQAGGVAVQVDSQKQAEMVQKLETFQQENGVDDAPACVGTNTWRALLCPLPLTTKMCHTELPCVLALQTLLFKWIPAGRRTGRYCKQTMNQMRIFQRLYKLDPNGNTKEIDFITLVRRIGWRTQGHDGKGEVPPA